jgi:pimeloyl-ACP methyl ester carboxylesterase
MNNNSKKTIILIHGGPGVSGYLAPLSLWLSSQYNVLEPTQRRSSNTPLTVKTHIEDLYNFIDDKCADSAPILIGHSWGAMLALAFAAEYPDIAKSLILIGCGTFDLASRADLNKTIRARTTAEIASKLKETSRINIPNLRFAEMGRIIDPIYSFDAEPESTSTVCDFQAFVETWNDMILLQNLGIYPSSFKNIQIPVSMIHGGKDPHPGMMIRENLLPFIPHLTYHDIPICGHYPWREKLAKDYFYFTLKNCLRTS